MTPIKLPPEMESTFEFDQLELKEESPKMVIVTREDISPGYQLVQTAHGIANFAAEHPEAFLEWQRGTNTLVCVSTPDEASLEKLFNKLQPYGVPMTAFREPDIDNQMTSFCILGTELIRSKIRFLPPTLHGGKNQAIKQALRTSSATNTKTASNQIL